MALDDAAKQQSDAGAANAANGGNGTYGALSSWNLNRTTRSLELAGKEDLVVLRKRLQDELERRDSEERGKSQVAQEE